MAVRYAIERRGESEEDFSLADMARIVNTENYKSGISSITETESMENPRPYLFWLKGRKSRHQFQINREN
jgi:predicted double-glycine peptidase